MTWHTSYSQLFNGCVFLSDGSLTSDGKLANLVNPSLNGTFKTANTEPVVATNKFGLSKAWSFDGTNDYIDLGNLGTVRSVVLLLKLDSTTGGLFYLTTSLTSKIDSDTISATGTNFSPTIYVDGAASSTLSDTSGWHTIALSNASNLTASAFRLGSDNSTYLDGTIGAVVVTSTTLSAEYVKALHQLLMMKPLTPIIPNAEGRLIA